MSNILSFFPRKIKPKGIKKRPPSTEKIKQFFFDVDYENIEKINPINHPLPAAPTLFYPGCGCDIITPLLFIEKLFPQLTEINLLFVDLNDNVDLITTILDDVGVTFSQDNRFISFYWNHLLVSLQFLQDDIFTTALPQYDIYFERSFRIMKDVDPQYEKRIYKKLNAGGLLISDSGFQNVALQKIVVPPELSAYNEMIAGIKKI
ncbi:hypothetical protein HYT55_02830 [Candidatus Woesearchaeota archaeon]|nr:hypothetical protein [Candidatus Woesearchaeota archaeon]